MSTSTGRIGQRFGPYELIKHLGEGGFADVYLAANVNLSVQQVAIKVLKKPLVSTKSEEFKREARIIYQLQHPSIVQMHGYDIYSNLAMTTTLVPYIVMDYAPNGSLRKNHPRGTPLDIPMIVSYIKQIAAALQYAHDKGVKHLDVKPENILVGSRQQLLLSDFGLAAVVTEQEKSQNIQGTLSYMSPEQLDGNPDFASDQYALAIMVYEWISGNVPFTGRTVPEVINKHCNMPPPSLCAARPSLSPHIEEVVMKALTKKAHSRYSTISEFAIAFEQAVNRSSGGAGTARPNTPPNPFIGTPSPTPAPPFVGMPSATAAPPFVGSPSPISGAGGTPFPNSPQMPNVSFPSPPDPLFGASGNMPQGSIFGTPLNDMAGNRPMGSFSGPVNPDSMTLKDTSLPPLPPYFMQPGNVGNNNMGNMAQVTSAAEVGIQAITQTIVKPLPRTTQRRRRPLRDAGIAADVLAAIFIGVWVAKTTPSTANDVAWVFFFFSALFSAGLSILFFASGNKLLNITVAGLLAFYWFVAGAAIATLIGAGSHIGFLPDGNVMAVLFLIASFGLHMWILFRRK